MAGLLSIPSEICLAIVAFVGVNDIVSLRQTCKYLGQITKDKYLWLSLLRAQEASLPVPPTARNLLANSVSKTNLITLERTCISLHRTQREWLLRRARNWRELPRLILPSSWTSQFSREAGEARSLIALNLFLDRWLVAAFMDVVEIWDLFPNPHDLIGVGTSWPDSDTKPEVRAVIHTPSDVTPWCSSYLDPGQNTIYIAITTDGTTRLHRFRLPTDVSPPYPAPELLHTFRTTAPYTVRAFDPSSNVIVFSHAQTISLVNLHTHVHWEIGVGSEGEELWSGIIGATFLTSRHILCLKTRSVELYTFSGSFNGTLLEGQQLRRHASLADIDIRRHDFLETTFRGVSFSDPKISRSSTPDGVTTISCDFLTYDVLRGLFHYRADVQFPRGFITQEYTLKDMQCSNVVVPLSLDTTLVSVHHMALSIPTTHERSDTPTPRTRSGFTPGSRGFVSACALGPQRTRGVWVERQRNSVQRRVFGFDVARDGTEDEGSKEIAGKCLFEVNSFDLRDDITHCAFSEVTGKVVLGTRNGEVLLL